MLYKVGIIIVVLVVLALGSFIYTFLGFPFLRLRKIGTTYSSDAPELALFNHYTGHQLTLIKKYKYSKQVLIIGYGGGSTRVDDHYVYGIASKDKKVLLPARYRLIKSIQFPEKGHTGEKTYRYGIHALPNSKNAKRKEEFFIFESGKLVAISPPQQWF